MGNRRLFVYAAAIARMLPLAAHVRNRVLLFNLAVILVGALLIHDDRNRRSVALGIIRDRLPLGLVLLAYREMGWFALPHPDHALESHWVTWDRLVLRGGARAAIGAFGPLAPAILEIAYALVYALAPFSLAMLYLYRLPGRARGRGIRHAAGLAGLLMAAAAAGITTPCRHTGCRSPVDDILTSYKWLY